MSGRSARGAGAWKPSRKIADALDAAFYAAFGAVESSGKRMLLAVDVSGSMGSPISGMPITAREASAALALVQLATEPSASAVGFTTRVGARTWHDSALRPLRISPRQRLDDALRVIDQMPMAGTDCALPMVYATEKRLKIDTFVVYTDNETWAGEIHPHQALAEYRRKSGIDAKLVAAQYRSERDRLLHQLRAEDPARWSYSALAAAAGCSRELIALVLRRSR